MAKLPAFQFYPADWRKDPAVQSLSYFDRGVWLEILCLMHESEQRGKLLLNGKRMPNEALARLLGLDKQILTKTLDTLLEYGVASIDELTGALISRRMVRDEEIRKIRTEAGRKGGNPNLLNQNSNQNGSKKNSEVKQNSTPSSSSSKPSSFSNEKKEGGGNAREGAHEERPPPAADLQIFQNRQWIELTPEEKQMSAEDFLTHLQKLHPKKNVRAIGKKLKKFCADNGKAFALERLKGWVEGEGVSLTEAEFRQVFGSDDSREAVEARRREQIENCRLCDSNGYRKIGDSVKICKHEEEKTDAFGC